MPNLGTSSSNQTFLPADYVRGRGERRARIAALLLFGVVLAGTGGVFVYFNQTQRALRLESSMINEEYRAEAVKIEQLKQLEAQRAQMLESAELVTALIDRVPRSVLLAELIRDMPATVVLTQLKLDGERVRAAMGPSAAGRSGQATTRSLTSKAAGSAAAESKEQKIEPPRFRHSVTVSGLALENNDVADYLALLKKSPLLKEVELQYIQETTVDDRELRKFQISMQIPETADARRVAGARETTLLENPSIGSISGVITDDE